MTTVLRASPRRFVSTPAVERIITRALRYLHSGYSVHLRGPAGTGKTTLALHLADLLARPIMLVYGDDEFKTSDLIGNQSGYTRKKVVDNFIHSVVKVEDELRQNWVDSRLTLACREGFTLVYDEFNRSRPEVNNVLLSALEEKLLVLPPSNNRSEYIRVNPQFRAIFTSNPEEYVGVHDTQDALLDRLITINIPEPDELTQQEILVQKTEIDRASALLIVRLVKEFRTRTKSDKVSGLRSCLMIAKICHDHEIIVNPGNDEFRDVCCDILLSRAATSLKEATTTLWELLNSSIGLGLGQSEPLNHVLEETVEVESEPGELPETIVAQAEVMEVVEATPEPVQETSEPEAVSPEAPLETVQPCTEIVLSYLKQATGARLVDIEQTLNLDRFQTVDSLRLLLKEGLVEQRDRMYYAREIAS
ncbi:MAG TPA: gas vesicle protein GvpN [Leptolyngbyaceae cyanobacterium M33_DOE_097]|uniref:Gas vesicle protein GvpN n=1 Tax=Oscillatoriales cyanobacterium SpSt-418 TaxID=2282169 RepID=A0A7C3KER4_9CYAN|nr:gas vesicle protein GvpN [Leptolyngbyaceae cyanobacterium M33_DOE_097]